MRARLFPSLLIATTISPVFLTVGCRGLRPNTDLIQVTTEEESGSEIQPIAQRLATNNKQKNESLASEVIRRSLPETPESRIAAQAERVKLRRNELLGLAPAEAAEKAVSAKEPSAPVSISLNDALAANDASVEPAAEKPHTEKTSSGMQFSLNDLTRDVTSGVDVLAIGGSDTDATPSEKRPVDSNLYSLNDQTEMADQAKSAPATLPAAESEQPTSDKFADMQQVHVAEVALPPKKSSTESGTPQKQPAANLIAKDDPPKVQLTSLLASRAATPGSLPVLEIPGSIGSVVQVSGTAPASTTQKVEKAGGANNLPDIQQAHALWSSAESTSSNLPLPPLSLSLPNVDNSPKSQPKAQPTSAVSSAFSMPTQPTSQGQPALGTLNPGLNPPESPAQNADPKVAQGTPELQTDPAFVSDEDLYKVLINRLSIPDIGESEAAKSRRLIMLRYLSVLAGQTPGDASLEGLNEQERKYLQHQLKGLRTMIDPSGHPASGRRLAAALPDIREASKYLAAAADSLEVRSLSFCTEIEAYGQVTTFPGNRFKRGQQVILYCELENFVVKDMKEGFETHIKGSYEIYDSANEKILSQTLPPDVQVASNYIRDYFVAYQMHLPQKLGVGTYRLQLTMEDVNGKKYGQASIPFEIAE